MVEFNKILWLLQMALFVLSTPIRKADNKPDSGMYNKRFFEGDIDMRRPRGLKRIDWNSNWPNGVVIYRTEEKLGCPDSEQCKVLMKAIENYHKNSCLRFQEWTGEENYVEIFINPDDGACWSALGRVGGQQLLSLGKRCWYKGIVVHELGHAIGLDHEMNRMDRDDYIRIVWDNILPGFRAAFNKHNDTMPDDDFDFKSIMMYDEFAFSVKPTLQTIIVKTDVVIGPVWNKPGLSEADITRIERMYKCKRDESLEGLPYDVKCSFTEHTCGFKSTGKNPWKWNNEKQSESFVYAPFHGTEESNKGIASYLVSVNFFGRNVAQNDILAKGCVSFSYIIQGNADAYLKLRQSFLASPTQLAHVAEDTFDLWESDNVTGVFTTPHVPLYVNKPFRLLFEASSKTEGIVAINKFELSLAPC